MKLFVLLLIAVVAVVTVGSGCAQSTSQEEANSMTTQTTTAPVALHWLDWTDELFDRAAAEDKLIVLDIGATWCHWCHVMDRVTYEDPEVIAMLNERFLAVRIDRDRQPQLDARMQRATALIRPMGQAGGWPLTVVLTPQRDVLFKATFLPPRASPEYPTNIGLIELLDRVDEHWRANREQIHEAAGRLRKGMAAHYEQFFTSPGELSTETLDVIFEGLRSSFDATHGGFGGAPKFFTATGLDFLLARAARGDAKARTMLVETLSAMSRGGIYDQLGGGFHRYSIDERWHVPHFEKMAYDNAALLALYADAFAMTGRDDWARMADETLTWIDETLADPNRRGFFASQNADVGLDDDGDYFTWTEDEVRGVLGSRAELSLTYFGVDEVGDVHGRTGRNVLHVTKTESQLARMLDRDAKILGGEIRMAKAKLLSARRKRTAPSVDKTIFADLNGMMIDAYLTAYERLGDRGALASARAILDSLLDDLRDSSGVFAHYRQDGRLREIGLLADQAWMGRALVHAYVVTLDEKYLAAAEKLADYIRSNLTADDGGLINAPAGHTLVQKSAGPTRSWEDSPSRSASSVAAHMLADLGYLTGRGEYVASARKVLESFAGGVTPGAATMLGGYAVATDRLLRGPQSILVIGPADDETTVRLAHTARKTYLPGAMVLVVDPGKAEQAKMLDRLGIVADKKPSATVCTGTICLLPAYSVDELNQRIAELLAMPAADAVQKLFE